MRILISACLLGACCRYDGKSKQFAAALTLRREHELVPVCPEQLGGLTRGQTIDNDRLQRHSPGV